jgi:hypothetical protein
MSFRRWIAVLMAVVIVGGIITGLFIWKPWQIARLSAATRSTLAISSPSDGSVVPLHSTVQIVAGGLSSPGFVHVELWVNDQLWAQEDFNPVQSVLQEFWGWTPSGEGEHKLLLRGTDARGEVLQSDPLTLIAVQQADVRFPIPFTAAGGESIDSLAQDFETDPQAILELNPGLDPGTPLASGQQVTIPAPVPNAPPATPQDGAPPAPPSQPLPTPQSPPSGAPGGSAQVNPVQLNLPVPPGFDIKNGIIIPKTPVDKLYLYASLAGGPWQRFPAGTGTFLPQASGGYELGGLIPPEALANLPKPTPFELEAWGWSGGQLIYLGRESGVLGNTMNAPFLGAITATQLEIIGQIRDQVSYESEWTIPSPIEGYYQGFHQGFRWSTVDEGVVGGIWQVSTAPFASGLLWTPDVVASGKTQPPKVVTHKQGFPFPSGQEQQELVPAKFLIDFSQYIDFPDGAEPSPGLGGIIQQALQPAETSLQRVRDPSSLLPTTFYVRVIPVASNKQLLEPSNQVVVRYGPPIESPVNQGTGPLYDVQVVSFQPYRPADPSYASCMVLSKPLQQCSQQGTNSFEDILNSINPNSSPTEPELTCTTLLPAGSQSCGCPGVKCESSDSGCGWNLACHLEHGLDYLGGLVKDFFTWVAKTYNKIKSAVVDFVANIGCSAFSGDAKDTCKAAVNLGVNIGLAYLGIPPELPEFDQLLDQGLEYAAQAAISEVTGCDPLCQDSIRKGLDLLAHPDKLVNEGLDYGLQLAQDELEKHGVTCDDVCKGIVKDAVKGDLDAGKYLDQALNTAAQEAADYLNSQGIPCDQDCKGLIKQKLKAGTDSFDIGPFGQSGQTAYNIWEPHPLAYEQPAVLTVRVTRRTGTAGIPSADIERCGLSVYNHAVNTIGGEHIEGQLFEAVGLDIPPIEPGEAMTIPILLDRSPWNPPAGFSPVLQAPPGTIIAGYTELDVGQWHLLYYGAQATFSLGGPYFSTLGSDGQTVGLPCVSSATYNASMPASTP